MARPRRRIAEATVVAGLVSGAPSTTMATRRGGPRSAWTSGLVATRAIATLVPPGRPGLLRGALVHGVISVACGELLGRVLLPRRHSPAWGAAAGLVLGVINVGVIGRRFPAIRALELGPQLADNVAFGVLFALVADRPQPVAQPRS